MTVHKVNHVEHHSNSEKLKTVQSQAKNVADKIATTRRLEAPPVPAAIRQEKRSSAIVEATSMADIYFLGERMSLSQGQKCCLLLQCGVNVVRVFCFF